MKHVIIELSALADECIVEMKKNQEMEMSEDDEFAVENATCCHICPNISERMTRESDVTITGQASFVVVLLTDST